MAQNESVMTDEGDQDARRRNPRYHFDRHTPEYRLQFRAIAQEMHARCPMAWTDTYDGHWVAGSKEVLNSRGAPGCPTTTTSTANAADQRHFDSVAATGSHPGAACWKWKTLSTASSATS